MVSSSGDQSKKRGIKSLFNNAVGRRSITALPPDPPPKQQQQLDQQELQRAMNLNSVTERLLPPKTSTSRPSQEKRGTEMYGGGVYSANFVDDSQSDRRAAARTSSIADSSHSSSSVSLALQQQQPPPPHSTTTTTSSTTTTRRLPKSAVRESQVGHLLNQVEQLKQEREQQCQELEMRYQKLQEMLTAKEQEYSRISSSFHRHIMVSSKGKRKYISGLNKAE